MDKDESGHITQKDLLKLLFDQAQHNATREELNALEARITNQINGQFEAVDKKFEAVDKKFEAVDKRFEAMDKRFDRLSWLIISTLIGVCASLALQLLK